MKTARSTDVKNRFGEFLEAVHDGPVGIERNGRLTAVMISNREYERLMEMEEAWWVERAERAEKEGYLGPKRTEKFLKTRMNESA